VRDFLLKLQAEWLDSLTHMARSAMRVGAFRRDIPCMSVFRYKKLEKVGASRQYFLSHLFNNP